MPRQPLIRTDCFSYHVTNRSNNREWFYLPIDEVWRVFLATLRGASERYQTEIHIFVLMSNHYHLILSTPQRNLGEFMRYFQTEATREIQRRADRINHVFGTRYKWSVLENPMAFSYAYKYVLRNPVRAGICDGVDGYPYGSWALLEKSHWCLPHTERRDLLWSWIPKPFDERLAWLNRRTPKEAEAMVQQALRRFRFEFSRGNDVRLAQDALHEVYQWEPSTRYLSGRKVDGHAEG